VASSRDDALDAAHRHGLTADPGKEGQVADQIPSAQSARFLQQAEAPFDPQLGPDMRSARNNPRGEIQQRSDTNRNDAKLFEIAFRPQLLTRLAHSNQDQARSRGRDGLPDRLLLITGKYPERWPTTRKCG